MERMARKIILKSRANFSPRRKQTDRRFNGFIDGNRPRAFSSDKAPFPPGRPLPLKTNSSARVCQSKRFNFSALSAASFAGGHGASFEGGNGASLEGGHAAGSDRSAAIYKCPFPDVQLPEIDLANYMLSEMEGYSTDVALVDGETGRPIRYDQLVRSVRGLAWSFRKMKITKDDVIVICANNCLEYVTVILAANLIGAAYSPLNPVYTSEEIWRAVIMTQAKVLVATKSSQQVCEEVQKNCSTLKLKISINFNADGWHNYADLVSTNQLLESNLDFRCKTDVASIPFSSGTTGAPKGVELTHFNLVSNIIQNRQETAMNYNRQDVLLAVLPFFHIYGNTIVLLAGLAAGTKIVVMTSFHPATYFKAIEDHKCTFLHIVPPILLLFNKHPLAKNLDLGRVRTLLTGAAPSSSHELQELSRRLTLTGASIRQGYGLTETSPITHVNPPQLNKWNSVGVAVHNTQFKFVSMPTDDAKDSENMMVIQVRGPQVMRGYLNDSKATDEVLSPDGWFDTGDVGYVDDDGYVIISDRRKELIKVKGFQVAPAELESLLLKHPGLSDAAVIGCVDAEAGERPVAFVVVKDGFRVSENDVMDHVAEHAAPFKRLAKVYFIDFIPKSPSGKILRRILKKQL